MTFTPSAVLNTSTLNQYLQTKTDPIFQGGMDGSPLMAGLKSHGRITYKNGGKTMKWHPRIRRRKIQAVSAYNTAISFPVQNTRMEVELEWRGYKLGEKINEFDRKANKNDPLKIADLYQETIDGMASDFIYDLASKLYLDGNLATTDLHGLESMFGLNGSPLIGAGSPCGNPDDDYASKATDLGGLGGDWTGVWPLGGGDTEYCAWSPTVIDYSNSFFGQSTYTWTANWRNAMNFAVTYAMQLQGYKPSFCLMCAEHYREAEDSLTTNERFDVVKKSKLLDLGFDTITYKGIEVAIDKNLPSDTTYLFPWEAIEFRSMNDSQLVEYEKDVKFETSEDLFKASFWGNLRFDSPAFFTKITSLTGT